uniref:(northern house mosquito) hypothetical protein n=1 Tax=Culex pipiens TaxID=7175 RepID=A0A8D8PGI8_CULPI
MNTSSGTRGNPAARQPRTRREDGRFLTESPIKSTDIDYMLYKQKNLSPVWFSIPLERPGLNSNVDTTTTLQEVAKRAEPEPATDPEPATELEPESMTKPSSEPGSEPTSEPEPHPEPELSF